MFHLTHAAATEIAEARQGRGLPDSVGLRVFGEPLPGGELAVSLTFAEVPAEDDQVSEQEGTRVFVASQVADAVADVVLDVEETDDGPKLVLTRT